MVGFGVAAAVAVAFVPAAAVPVAALAPPAPLAPNSRSRSASAVGSRAWSGLAGSERQNSRRWVRVLLPYAVWLSFLTSCRMFLGALLAPASCNNALSPALRDLSGGSVSSLLSLARNTVSCACAVGDNCCVGALPGFGGRKV